MLAILLLGMLYNFPIVYRNKFGFDTAWHAGSQWPSLSRSLWSLIFSLLIPLLLTALSPSQINIHAKHCSFQFMPLVILLPIPIIPPLFFFLVILSKQQLPVWPSHQEPPSIGSLCLLTWMPPCDVSLLTHASPFPIAMLDFNLCREINGRRVSRVWHFMGTTVMMDGLWPHPFLFCVKRYIKGKCWRASF